MNPQFEEKFYLLLDHLLRRVSSECYNPNVHNIAKAAESVASTLAILKSLPSSSRTLTEEDRETAMTAISLAIEWLDDLPEQNPDYSEEDLNRIDDQRRSFDQLHQKLSLPAV